MASIYAGQRNPTRDWWIASTQHRTHKGEALDFSRHRFQPAILKDKAQHIVVAKATQCGVSELEIDHALSLVDQGRNVFWVFPDQDLRNMFIKDRFDLSVSNTPHYQMLVSRARSRFQKGKDATDEVRIKQLGTASICFVGSNSVTSFKSFSADDAIVDEVDQCSQVNLAMVPDRFAASPHRTTWRVGNPTISGYGIDALYAESDRKRWFIRCEHCGERQPLDWFVNVVREISEGMYEPRGSANERGPMVSGAEITPGKHAGMEAPFATSRHDLSALCRRCERPLDRLSDGEWIAEHPDRSISGYQINQIFSGSVPLSEMWEGFQRGLLNESELMRFFNSALGIAFTSRGSQLTELALNECRGDYGRATKGSGCFVGIDVGTLLHVCVLHPDGRVLSIQALQSFDECKSVMRDFGAALVVIDALPETRKAREFAADYRGRALLCWYIDSNKVEDFAVNFDTFEVKADRTQTLDESYAALIAKLAQLPRDAASVPDFYAHMRAVTRIFDRSNQDPKKHRFRWVEGSQTDHYRHAFNYAWLARTIRQRTGSPSFAFSLGTGLSVG